MSTKNSDQLRGKASLDNRLDYYHGTKGYVGGSCIYDITKLYADIERIFDNIKVGYTIGRFFETLPKLNVIQYVLDKMNPDENKYNNEIIIEI